MGGALRRLRLSWVLACSSRHSSKALKISSASSLIQISAQVSTGAITCSGMRGVEFSPARLDGAAAQPGRTLGSKVKASLVSLPA
jgi:hypothetical protein